jgi:hypothetical protein
MNHNPFYHGIVRKLIVAVGSIFTGIKIERRNSLGAVEQTIDVPVSYGNREKWLQRLQEEPELDKRVLVSLPRIGFEMTGLSYDSARKLNKLTQLRTCGETTPGNISTAFSPVPYNIDFTVYVMTKTQEDGLQIVEQILPYFSPQYVISVNLIPEMGIVQDVPFTLNGVVVDDSYEGPMENRREIIYTLNFTAKTEFLGPINTGSNGVIMHTRVKIDPMYGEIARQVNTDATGTPDNHVIVDDFFDIARPIVNPPPVF